MGFFDLLFGSYEPAAESSNLTIYDNSYFKNNDEDRAICEDMYADRYHDHEIDLEDQYGWENKLNYDTDGYSAEEDW